MEKSNETYTAELNGKKVDIRHDLENNKVTATHSDRTNNERKQVTLIYDVEKSKASLNVDASIADMTEYLALIEFMNNQIVELLNPVENA